MTVDTAKNGTVEDMDVTVEGETPEDDDSKYTEDDQARRVVVKNFNFKATAEEIRGFFDDEKFEKIEHVSRKFKNWASWKQKKNKDDDKPLKRVFNGAVIVTFEDEESAKKFLENKDLKMDDRRLRMHSCEESKARREKFLEIKEASKKKKQEAIKKKKSDEVAAKKKAAEEKKSEAKAKNDKSTSPSDCIVVCKGFHMNAGSLQEVMKYFYDNHEKVIDVNMEVLRDGFGNPRFDDKAFITFMNKGAADKFKDLAYVRFKGKAIDRFSVQEFKEGKKKPQKGKQEEKAGVKRKLPQEEKKPVELEKGAAIKIMGIKNKNTKALDVKDKLKNLDVKWEEVVFVNHPKGEEEAQVRLKGEAAKNVAELVKKLNEDNIMMGDLVTAARLTGKAEKELDEKTKEHLENYVPKKFKNKKQKK